MRFTHLIVGTIVLASTLTASAQEVRIERRPGMGLGSMLDNLDPDRATIGVSLGFGGKRDTLGVLVTGITEGGPAEKAGLEEGNRIAAINGVDLRIAPADAGESDMAGAMSRRLQRELRKVKAGDEVELRVYANGQVKAVKIKTEESGDVTRRRTSRVREEADDRPVVGLNLGGGSSARDSLGVLVIAVEDGGPAEKAGIYEGARIASVGGVDLRVRGADGGDDYMGDIMSRRFTRELRKAKAGDEVEIRFYLDGQNRTARVKTVRAGDLYKDDGRRRFFFNSPEGVIAPMPPMPPMPPMRVPVAPRARVRVGGDVSIDTEDFRTEDFRHFVHDQDFDELSVDLDELGVDLDELGVDLSELHRDLRPVISAGVARATHAAHAVANATANVLRNFADDVHFGDETLYLNGLRVTPMSEGLASYFGKESVRGVLVLEAGTRWPGVNAGDVILSVNNNPVRRGDDVSITVDTDEPQELVLIRKGERRTLTVPARHAR